MAEINFGYGLSGKKAAFYLEELEQLYLCYWSCFVIYFASQPKR